MVGSSLARDIEAATFWRMAHGAEALAQLKTDLHLCIGRLMTQCYQAARTNPEQAEYWTARAQQYEVAHKAALMDVDQMLILITQGHTPTAYQVNDQRVVHIGNIQAGGDVVISTVHDSQHVATGKDLTQSVGPD